MTDTSHSQTPSPSLPETSFSEGSSSLFQPAAKIGELAKESLQSGTEIVGGISQLGSDAVKKVGAFMAEPSSLFQPTKAVSTLGGVVKNVAGAGIEGIKDVTSDTIGIATGAVGDVVNIGKDIANIRTEPNPEGDALFQPKKPIAELGNIGTKVIKSGIAIASGGVGAGVSVAKGVLGTGTNIIKKGLGIFGKKDKGEEKK